MTGVPIPRNSFGTIIKPLVHLKSENKNDILNALYYNGVQISKVLRSNIANYDSSEWQHEILNRYFLFHSKRIAYLYSSNGISIFVPDPGYILFEEVQQAILEPSIDVDAVARKLKTSLLQMKSCLAENLLEYQLSHIFGAIFFFVLVSVGFK